MTVSVKVVVFLTVGPQSSIEELASGPRQKRRSKLKSKSMKRIKSKSKSRSRTQSADLRA
jgi:hypothetical protein